MAEKHQQSGKHKDDEETKPLDEDKVTQATVAVRQNSLLCPSCHAPHRQNARFCGSCGQSLVETEALPQMVTKADKEYASLSLVELRQMKTPEAAVERYRRAVEAMMAYNDTVDLSLRWYINVAAVRQLVGGRAPNVQEYLDSRRTEIEVHHHKHRLLPGHNRGKTVAITECIPIPDPQRVEPQRKMGFCRPEHSPIGAVLPLCPFESLL